MSVQSKHILNDPSSLVLDSLQGLCAVNPRLALDHANRVVYVASPNPSRVSLVCGGGSGHEPAHAGFVGDGILTAAVCGNVFASPNASQVRRGIDLLPLLVLNVSNSTLIVVKNYTGDVLNFGLAKEQYAASHPDKAEKVKFLVVGDDVAVGKSQGKIVGRRGLAGTVLVYKIAGALAKRGASLDEVYSVAEYTANHLGTTGVGLEHCHVPGTASSESHLSPDEIEIGMGIHNEAGNKRLSPIPRLNHLVDYLLTTIISTDDVDRSFVPFRGGGKDRVVVLINNLGGLSELELSAVAHEVSQQLRNRNIYVERLLSGTFMTSLNMPGFSITLLLLPDANHTLSPDLILSLLDEPTDTPGWKWSSRSPPAAHVPTPKSSVQSSAALRDEIISVRASDPSGFISAIERACYKLIDAEPELTKMDTIAGDGDCGLTLKEGANGVLKSIKEGKIRGDDLVGSLIAIASVAEEQMGGTSGALYSIFFSALALGIQSSFSPEAGPKTVTSTAWGNALTSALAKLYTYTRARRPSRTLVDPLSAFIESFGREGEDLDGSVRAAVAATEKTRELEAKAGRSAYVESATLKKEKVPDPGAWGVKVILEGLTGK